MSFSAWWQARHRGSRNALVVLAIDILLLASALAGVPGLSTVWGVLTDFLPNIYEPVFLQLIALLRDMSPGALVAGGLFVSYATLFLTLVSVHALIAAGIGFVLAKTKDTAAWSVVNYAVLILILFFFHLFLLGREYFLLV